LEGKKSLAPVAIQKLLCVTTHVEENRGTLVSASCKVGNKICCYMLRLNVLSDLQLKLTLRISIEIHGAVWEMNGATEKNQ
jgi:hypothetical protein